MTQRILVLGATGMLGNVLFRYLAQNTGYETFGTLRSARMLSHFPKDLQSRLYTHVDVLDSDCLLSTLEKIRPDIIINCVGLIKQLGAANDPLQALPINAMLPHRLARICALIQCRLVHISTDCVFSGKKGMYSEEDLSDAEDLYGKSKYIGELHDYPHAITLRTSIIGHELNSHIALVDWFLSQQQKVKGYTKAIFSGFPTIELAHIIAEHVIPNEQLSGLFQVSAQAIDKFNLLKIIAEIYGKNIEIEPHAELTIDRSLNSQKFKTMTGYIPPQWPDLILKMYEFK